MKRRTLVAALAAAGVLAVSGGTAAAVAATSVPAGGPPVVTNPTIGPYYKAGPVNLCVNQATQQVRVETRTLVLGNCAAGEVQLTLVASPGALAPPAP